MLYLICGLIFTLLDVEGSLGTLEEEPIWRKAYNDIRELDELNLPNVFKDWKTFFSKEYQSLIEEAERFGIWLSNWKEIIEFNLRGNETYTKGMNQFSDLTGDEFKEYVGSEIKPSKITVYKPSNITAAKHARKLLSSVDWSPNYVTPVKNQGSCGGCWSFAVTGAIECNHAINTQTIRSLSEQELLDCSSSYGNQGCNGGWPDDGFKYVQANNGLCQESDYAYTGSSSGTCQKSYCTHYSAISSYTDVTRESVSSLESALQQTCVSVAIQANQNVYQFYSGGVITSGCGSTVDHAVLAVGYGTDSTYGDYWKIKNSWGTTWGESGYGRITRNYANSGQGECGILYFPSWPYSG